MAHFLTRVLKELCESFLRVLLLLIVVVFRSCQVFCLRVLRAERRKDVSGETVLITGASRGIGRCLALEFAKHGACTIILWGRDEEKLSSVKKEVEEIGKTVCHFYRCDVGDREQVYRTMQKVQENVGKITILVNNAGVVHGGALLETKDDNIEDTLRVNTLSHFWTTKSVLPSMLSNGRGHVVGIASTLGLFALPGVSDYVTSKFSVVGFYESLAAELRAQGRRDVGVTCVCPGHTTTDMFKDLTTQSFSLTPQQVAEQTVDAVKNNQRRVILPRIMHFTWILNSWLPGSWMRTVLYVTGAMKDMENFCAKR
ncbi:PREDICTED: short-chain dehydrogenase/reductase 3-like [Branchiostoma belcheri]|uniref:Short-chain dehydrogenase/reductase 3 n=1 Tax=Branchiostoma belcheri TaxID=7741 RepID=A0A6P4ZGA8_BRABE|nr:PREDICTED: short-chain dehydrogenase/reductase 3-like [Branchiostoma belcheri]